MLVQAFTTIAAVLAGFVSANSDASNPVVSSPNNMTYISGQTIPIQWTLKSKDYGFVNVEMENVCLSRAVSRQFIATVPASQEKLDWVVPDNVQTSACYRVLVWPVNPPAEYNGKSQEDGASALFTIVNLAKDAVSRFVVKSPANDVPFKAGSTVDIKWDFVESAVFPAYVNIELRKIGERQPILAIAQNVDAKTKSYTWSVPNDPSLLTNDLYVSVSGSTPLEGPSMSNSNMGGSSQQFNIVPYVEKVETPAPAAQIDDPKDSEKVTGEVKKQSSAATVSSASSALQALAILAAMAVFVPTALI